jgi:ABC-type cobalamin transport system ATPase subunit
VAAAGSLKKVLTSRALSDCYGLDLRLANEAGRWTVRVAQGT